MNNNLHRRKQHELFLLERFITTLGLVAEVIEERERPDFIIRLSDRVVGVEITQLYISHDQHSNTMQAQESISSRIVASAKRL